jgi:peroxiredoxin
MFIARAVGLSVVVGASLVGADIPRPAPELAIKMVGGGDLQLSKYRGKVIGLEFGLTTCVYCQRTATALQKMNQEFGPRGFQPLVMAINDMAQIHVQDFVKQFSLTFPVGYGQRDTAVTFLQHPVIMQLLMPQLVFIDRKGVIRAQYGGGDPFYKDEEKNMREMIVSLLKETGAPPSAKAKPAAAKKPT